MAEKKKTTKLPQKEDSKQMVATTMIEAKDPKTCENNIEIRPAEFGACENCHTTIKGQAVHALGKIWHPEHFVCAACKKPISGQVFNVHEGKPYCEQDYSNKYLNKCRACGLPIKDVTIQALGSTWHKEHFVCKSCSSALAGQGFYERENSPFCQKCFESQYSPKCDACHNPIVDTAMMALGKNFHPGCFKCSRCQLPFNEPTYHTINNEPYCDKCNEVTQQILANTHQ